jgi:ADP-ribose pyrophosphatase YjhB (NUDIX family)
MSLLSKILNIRKSKEDKKNSSFVLAIIRSENKILLGKRKDSEKWTFVGGGVEKNETVDQAILREIHEESGIALTSKQVEFKESVISNLGVNIFIYEAFIQNIENVTNDYDIDDEFSEMKLFDLSDVTNCNIPMHFDCEYNVGVKYLKENDISKSSNITTDSIDDKIKDNIVYKIKNSKSLIEKAKAVKEFKSLSLVEKAKSTKEFKDFEFSNNDDIEDKDLENAISYLSMYIPSSEMEVLNRTNQHNLIFEWYNKIKDMPKTYDQDGKGDDAIAYLHYFIGGSDWYITENDKQEPPIQAFGFSVLNGDYQNAEIGYISISELISNGVELDLYFKPLSVKEIKEKMNKGSQNFSDKSDNESSLIYKDALEILKKDDLTYDDLKYFSDDVIDKIEQGISDNYSLALEVDSEATNAIDKHSYSANTLDNVEDTTMDGITEKKISDLLNVIFIEKIPNTIIGRAKREDATEKLRHILETDKSARDILDKAIEGIEDDSDLISCDAKNLFKV